MAEFLSPAWIEELDRAARDARVPAMPGAALTVEQRVQHVPGLGEVRYHVVFDAAGVRVAAGSASRPTVVVDTDFATARALARGETNAQTALSSGRWKVRGNFGALSRGSGPLLALDDIFAAVRATTVYPD